jgi:hypothetical protein
LVSRQPPPNVPPWQNNILKKLRMLDITQFRAAILDKEKTLYIVSDGGVHNHQSNFGATITASSSPLAHTNGKIYRMNFYESSYRSELYGMLAGVVMLQHLFQTESISLPEEKEIQIYCDNRSVANKIKE